MWKNPLFQDREIASLISEDVQILEIMRVETDLAEVQASLGLMSPEDAELLADFAEHFVPDRDDVRSGYVRDGVPVPAILADFRQYLADEGAGQLANLVHRGPTSQDVMDTALVLCLRDVLDEFDFRLNDLIGRLASLASEHAETVIAARTRNQVATPTTLGLRIAGWLAPLVRHRDRLRDLRPRLLVVSLAGASGNLSAFEGRGIETASLLAKKLDLGDQAMPWHTARDGFAEFAGILAMITGSLGKLALDLLLSAQADDGVRAGGGGSSSTMPHKSNPTREEAILAIARINAGLVAQVQEAMIHPQERDGTAWFQEREALQNMIVMTGSAMLLTTEAVQTISVDEVKASRVLETSGGVIMGESACFALAEHIGLVSARDIVKRSCQDAIEQGRPLREILEERTDTGLPIDWDEVFAPASQIGEAREIVEQFLGSLSIRLDRVDRRGNSDPD